MAVDDRHERDLYFEEVGAIVDSVVDAYNDGELGVYAEIEVRIGEACEESSYVNDNYLAAVVLRWSNYPTAYFAEYGWNNREEGISPSGIARFPWSKLAFAAMNEDVRVRVFNHLSEVQQDSEDEQSQRKKGEA